MAACIDCGATLTNANWSPSSQRSRRYICRGCATARATAHVAAHREKVRLQQAAYYRAHKEAFARRAKAYQKAHPEKARAWARNWARRNRATETAKHRRYAQAHKGLLAQRAKAKRDALRQETLQAYGGACTCCGETRPEFLAVDHTNGDGAAHRREAGMSNGTRIYCWLKKHGFPKDRFRLLCHNCNLARGFYGYCPHERETVVTPA